jgi:hypothetical protein
MGSRLISAKKKARRRRHKKARDLQAPAPERGQHNGGRPPMTRVR